MLGRQPKDDPRLLASLLAHKAEEAEHGVWAKRDYLTCGGDQATLDRPAAPPEFAVAATWWWLALSEDPFGYLGAEYLFERLTMCLAPDVLAGLGRMGIDINEPGFGFLVEHAKEDVKHTNLILHSILEVVTGDSSRGDAILRGFDRFAQVYPLPVWTDDVDRTTRAVTE